MSTRRGERRGSDGRAPRVEQVEITSIGNGGEGVGRLADGRAVFVHRTAPAEVVRIELITMKPRWARGRLLEVLEASPERRDGPCPHYANCGGCTLEHLLYPAQLRAKGRIVADALRRIGGITVEPPNVVPSPAEFNYRNRVSFALHRGARGSVVAGFHALHAPDDIIPIDGACLLPEESIGQVWDRLRAAWGPDARMLPSGERLRLTLRATTHGSVSLLIEGGFSRGRPEELLAAVDGLAAIWHHPEARDPELLAGAPGLPESWGDESFELGGTAFLQVNRAAAAVLEAYVMELAGDVEGQSVVDAYCGIGIHARRLARAGASVTGIELDPTALDVAEGVGADGIRYLNGRVENLLGEALPADLVVLNPPRAGVDPAAIDTLLAEPPGRVIYISCDPATLARDLKRLAGAFHLTDIRCFDLFPQTAHVETVVQLRTRDESAAPES
ncbi:MAG: class I SAM-dependent RNA methyltransferase [Gemmatimonadota bacterium]